jgi:O-antigen/teichoic acid export membrane protein
MAQGSAWMVAMRWTMRGIGLVSTIILARLLFPADFGLVAMAMVVIGFLEVFTHTGVDLALIRNPEPTRAHYDTAWTIEVLQGIALALVLVLVAPLAGVYFSEPRVVAVIRLLALRALIGGFENIGVVDFRRELEFDKEFRFGVYKKAISFGVTIVMALILRNYWALVIGMVGGRCAEVILSYGMHSYRPRFNLTKLRDIWLFSQWLLLWRVGRYLNRRTDEFIVGGIAGTVVMGNYHVASDISTAPSDEIGLPMARGLFPFYSRLAGNMTDLANSFANVLSIVTTLCVGAGFGIAAVAEDLVIVVLSEKWLATVPFMQWLAIFGAVAGIISAFETLMPAMGKVRPLAVFTWINFLTLAPILMLAGYLWGITEIAIARTLVTITLAPLVFYLATIGTAITLGRVANILWPRLAAGAIMVVAVRALHLDYWNVPIITLLLDVLVGAMSFTVATFLLWLLMGRPDGLERTTLNYLAAKFARSRPV